MQKDCKDCRGLLWDYLAKELSDTESKKIEKHLQGCPSCRQEAEQVSLLVSALREEVPLPPSFSAGLHEKLSRAAEEMAAEKPSRQRLPRWGGFKTLAPALVCLALAVGVFSSGLYDQWRNADRMLTENPVTSSAPAESDPPAPVVTNPATAAPQPVTSAKPATEAPAPAQTETVTPPAAETPAPATDTPSPAMVEDVPAPASMGIEEAPAGFAIPRHRPKVVCLAVADAEGFLNSWQESTGYDWEPHIQDVPADEIVSGVDPAAMVLQLSPDSFDSLMDYAAEAGNLEETQGETLVIIAGDEE